MSLLALTLMFAVACSGSNIAQLPDSPSSGENADNTYIDSTDDEFLDDTEDIASAQDASDGLTSGNGAVEDSSGNSVSGGTSTTSGSGSSSSKNPGSSSQGASSVSSKAGGSSSASSPMASATAASSEMRAVWISFYELSFAGKTEKQFQSQINSMFDNVKAMHFNTVITHVRPNSDAYYKSSYFPWSAKITGQQGKDPGYDPLAYMVRAAHERGLKIQAWINPYRVSSSDTNISNLSSDNPARKWLTDSTTDNDHWVIVKNGIFYNPAIPEVQKLVVDGVRELVNNYNIDGIHFDDYFYPSTDTTIDSVAYGKYKSSAGNNALSLGDWRRANVNALVQAVYRVVDAKHLPFGISPSAHISTNGTDKNYTDQYADIRLWMRSSSYIHYIVPQLYFGFEYKLSQFRFDVLADQWMSIERSSSIKLYVGLAGYKIGTVDAGSTEWQDKTDILSRQLTYLRDKKADGFVMFSYGSTVNTSNLNKSQMELFTALLK